MLAKMDKSYAGLDPQLLPFYKYPTTLAAFESTIKDKSTAPTNRKVLVEVFESQYKQTTSESYGLVEQNIQSLKESHTYTVTTAHQPSLLTGPLYFIYKIFSTINLSQTLNKTYSQVKIVPVFVIGGEDHDFDEVNNTTIFGKKIIWESSEKGSVGMMKTESLKPVLEQLKTVLGESDLAKEIFTLIEKAYTEQTIYHNATQALLYALFGKYGLLILNMNDKNLKQAFVPIMTQELIEQPSKALIEQTQHKLVSLGFKAQAYPREINLFYLREGLRERIVLEDDTFKALNTDYSWSKTEILKHLNEHPEYFSPNVIMRPLFQELILPNLAYIGGGGELAYWLERKTQFEHFGINFPMLIRRNSVLFVDKPSQDKMQKLNLQLEDLAGDIDLQVKNYVTRNAEVSTQLTDEKIELETLFDSILEKAKLVDMTLEKSVLAEKTKQLQSLEALESRLTKAEKQKHEVATNQIKAIATKLFPGGGLQERSENFLPLYLKHGETFFETLLQNCNPLKTGLIVVG
jgi:bacillithiol synthase